MLYCSDCNKVVDEEGVMQLHPKKSRYVNFAENCLHLWRPIDAEIPTPPTYMVGPEL